MYVVTLHGLLGQPWLQAGVVAPPPPRYLPSVLMQTHLDVTYVKLLNGYRKRNRDVQQETNAATWVESELRVEERSRSTTQGKQMLMALLCEATYYNRT